MTGQTTTVESIRFIASSLTTRAGRVCRLAGRRGQPYRGGRYLALEVKSSPRVQDAHLKGLRAVARLPGLQRRVVVYTGERSQRTPDGINVWPVATFLKHLRDGTLWDER